MKVLHFYKTSIPDSMGGVEQVIHQLARGSSRIGIKASVLSLTPRNVPRSIEFEGYQLHRAKLSFQLASTGFSASAFLRFRQLSHEADVIHYHFPWPFMDILHFLTNVRKPSVVTYHSDIIRQKNLLKIYQPLGRAFLGSVDHIVATSPNYLCTSKLLAEYQSKVSVIPIGIDSSTYPEPSAGRLNFWRERVGSKFFLFVGVLRYYKGLHILIEAIKGTGYPLIIVGAGPIEDELRAQIVDLSLTNVQFLGHLSDEDKVALLMLSYGILFPSHLRSEAFGISLLEGAMFGKPMISSEIGTGTSFINISGETGLVVPPSDPRALRSAMVSLWVNPDLAMAMGRSAQARYHQLFTADRMIHSYSELYARLI